MQLLCYSQLDDPRARLYQTRRGPLTLDQVCEWLEIGKIIKQFGDWAVTDYGIECLVEYYPIEKAGIAHNDWVRHISEKNWVTGPMIRDLTAALAYAKTHFDLSKPTGLASRFAILKRDGYRCQLCGRGAQDGVTLEVDHKTPRSKGGTNDPANLWTLCFDCNRGKRASDL